MENISVGIIGVGMVGGAVSEYYRGRGFKVFLYDKNKGIGNFDEAARAQFIFLCLPSPTLENGKQDLGPFEETLPALPSGAKVIIKSTVLPGTTEKYQRLYHGLVLLHNPEFLDTRTAVRDFAQPDIQVVGYTSVSKPHAEEVMKLLPPALHQELCLSRESEAVKYFLNAFLAAKNTFANQIYDYCVAKDINYEVVKNIVRHAPRIGGEIHLNVFADGYRGFSGACLPKDISALVHDARTFSSPLLLVELVKMLNDGYINGSEQGQKKREV